VRQESVDEERRDRIGETIDQAGDLVVRYLTDRAGLSLVASHVLNRLHREGPSRLTALAAKEGVSQPSMTQLIQRMERQGLVSRLTDPDDGRAALVVITTAGEAVLEQRKQLRRERLAELLRTLTETEASAMALACEVALPILQRLSRHADTTSRADAESKKFLPQAVP
jgi:DNA-binding MarR family transcriptional regulator